MDVVGLVTELSDKSDSVPFEMSQQQDAIADSSNCRSVGRIMRYWDVFA
jgi:hypothetical protein